MQQCLWRPKEYRLDSSVEVPSGWDGQYAQGWLWLVRDVMRGVVIMRGVGQRSCRF